MPEFRSWNNYSEFAQSAKLKNRYIRDSSAEEFLNTVLATSKKRERKILKGNYMWRAQLGHHWEPIGVDEDHIDEELCPLPPERMKPLPNIATEGRANPKGIPYLYLSTEMETAMAEVRPWIGSLISVGQFMIMRDLIVIDCSAHKRDFTFYFTEPDPETRERAVWSHIDNAFSIPISPTDHTAEYIPTQIIAELFKNNGADGIIYRSSLGNGLNVVLFDLAVAELVTCSLYEARKLSFDFKETANPYFVKKHYDNHDSV